ncbi:MAG: hypothetical protein K8L91_10800 [Anaerolineae bacterium]|nr:hypothetical protein [Anaerolineae bacterium]
MQDDKVIYTSDLGRQIRIASSYEGKTPADAEMFLDAVFTEKRLGFENLFRLDEVIRENVLIDYDNEQIVCKFIG